MENTKNDQAEQDARLKSKMSRIKNKIIVMSGKGGVGKTTVAVNIAYALAASGLKVGILDTDIHGPNIAKMLGIEKKALSGTDSGIVPVEVMPNLSAVSLALTGYDPDQPIIWRGPLKMNVIQQFLSDVIWGDLDYLVIDSPPGTGDEPLSVCQLIKDVTGAVIVTTPQDVAVLDARKTVLFARQLRIPVLGIVENMSGLICPHCKKEIDLFKAGGGENAALGLNVPFLGRIPLEPEVVASGDDGKPYISRGRETKAAAAINDIVKKIVTGDA
ncbi:MAG: Mrp/NBP35 family ATP-binding protein [Candidatus Omnitrophota bacterium]|jgi:Mrp family chromosome partitioning ATPase